MTLPAPLHRCQLDGTPFGPANCTAASAAMALDAYTDGLIRPTPDAIRRRQSDQVGGIDCNDAAEAWRAYGQTLDVSRPTWTALIDRLRAGDGAIIQGDYGAVPDTWAIQDSFDGGHAVYVQRVEGDRALVNDPLHPTGAIWWPLDVLRAYWDNLPSGRAAWGHGVYAPPVAATHRCRANGTRLRVAPNLSATVRTTVRLGALARVEGPAVGGARYVVVVNGRRIASDRWVRIVARAGKRLPAPLYSAAALWQVK